MISYEFGLSGHWWVLALSCLIATGFAIYSYRTTIPAIPFGCKLLLITLRSIALSLLLFILFEPIVNIIKATEEPPLLAVLLDNSTSLGIEDASIDRRTVYTNAVAEVNPQSLGERARVLRFDNDVDEIAEFTPDSLQLDGQLTNISNALQTVFANAEQDNLQAVLLMTDGAFNAGENPLYNAELLGRPVYVVGVGDSTEPRDISVQAVITNEVAYVDSPIPVNANIKMIGFDGEDIEVKLHDNGVEIDVQTIKARPDVPTQSLVFEYTPKTEGVHKLSVEISHLEGELTTKNNSGSEFVKALKNKRRLILFAGAPSPDVSFLRTALERDKNIEIKTFIQKKGAEYYEGNPQAGDLATAEAILLVGFPISSSQPETMELIRSAAERGKPLLFIASKSVSYERLRPLEPYLPFNTSSSRSVELMAFADVKENALNHPTMKITGSDLDAQFWNKLPPIFRTETFVRTKAEAEVLATIKINNAPLNEPLLMQRSLQNKKSLAILGYGLYRWKLLGYAAESAKGRSEQPDVYTAFIRNGIRWLTTQEQGKLVRIKTGKRLYASGEKVELIGQVYDATYNPIDNADIRVTVTGEQEPRELMLSPLGGGRYTAEIDGLAEGNYAFNGVATINGVRHGSDNGRFSMGEINIEYQNAKMNAALLRAMADRTGGKFYTVANAGAALNDITNSARFAARPVTERNEYPLWNISWLLATVILLLGIEWFMRKRSGMV